MPTERAPQGCARTKDECHETADPSSFDAANDLAYAVTTDAIGNVFFAGTFAGTLSIDPNHYFSAGLTDIFLACFDPQGEHVWSRAMGAADVDSELRSRKMPLVK